MKDSNTEAKPAIEQGKNPNVDNDGKKPATDVIVEPMNVEENEKQKVDKKIGIKIENLMKEGNKADKEVCQKLKVMVSQALQDSKNDVTITHYLLYLPKNEIKGFLTNDFKELPCERQMIIIERTLSQIIKDKKHIPEMRIGRLEELRKYTSKYDEMSELTKNIKVEMYECNSKIIIKQQEKYRETERELTKLNNRLQAATLIENQNKSTIDQMENQLKSSIAELNAVKSELANLKESYAKVNNSSELMEQYGESAVRESIQKSLSQEYEIFKEIKKIPKEELSNYLDGIVSSYEEIFINLRRNGINF